MEKLKLGKLTWSINVTLDGCSDHTQVVADGEFHTYGMATLNGAAALMLGRASYELLESYWPSVARGEGALDDATIALARALDAKPKYVASRTLNSVRWNASLLEGDLDESVRRLKQQPGDILIFGSPGLGAALTELGLVDEHHFLIQPITCGHGPYLSDRMPRTDYRLIESRAFASGIILARYEAQWASQRPRVRRESRERWRRRGRGARISRR